VILPNHAIRRLALDPEFRLLEPFSERVERGVVSYGLSYAGYDLRLSRKVKIFKNSYGMRVSPKRFKEEGYAEKLFDTYEVKEGEPIVIPSRGYILGASVERIRMPNFLVGTIVGKSTYARAGIIVNTTPAEPGWCTPPDTEALTPEGWRALADVKEGDGILCRTLEGGSEFMEVQRKHDRYYSGDLLWFDGRSVEQLVTPDHRMFVHNRYWSKPRLVPAETIFGRWNYSLDREVRLYSESPATVEVAGRSYDSDAFAEFYGCWLGDGSAWHGSDGGYHIRLSVVTKERKRVVFRDVLSRLGVEKFREDGTGMHWYDKALSNWLRQHGHAKDKFVLPEFMRVSPRFAQKLLSGLISSDGNQETQTFCTSSKKLADCAQMLAFYSGSAAIVRHCEGEVFGMHIQNYRVRICDDQLTPRINPNNHRVVPYSGQVQCVTVPSGVWFSRRNGKASWTGNCGYLTIEISNDNPCEVELYPDEGVAQLRFERLESLPEGDYSKGGGKYQDQGPEPAPSRVL
jgi:deoxycytidine triphosphate deaminase